MDYEAVLEDAEGERAYGLDVQASDGSLAGSMRTKVVVLDVNEPPVLEGSVNVSIYDRDVDTYTAHDPEGTPITWSLSGPDAAAFRLAGSGDTRRLYFDRAAPPNTSYSVTVVAQDATGLAASLAVSVSVLEREEPTPTPTAGHTGGGGPGLCSLHLPTARGAFCDRGVDRPGWRDYGNTVDVDQDQRRDDCQYRVRRGNAQLYADELGCRQSAFSGGALP